MSDVYFMELEMIAEASFLQSRETGLKTNNDSNKGAELKRHIRKTYVQQRL